MPSPAATDHSVNSFGEKTLAQNWSLITYDVDDLFLVGLQGWAALATEPGDSETHQHTPGTGYRAVNVCVIAYGTWLSSAQPGRCLQHMPLALF